VVLDTYDEGVQLLRTAADQLHLTADNVAIQDLARIQGQGQSVLRGVGIVTGLGVSER
jgi:flagellar basal body P-ring protein FlgI